MTFPRKMVKSPLSLTEKNEEDMSENEEDMSENEGDMSEAELQSFLDYDNDKLINDEFSKFIQTIKDKDISPDAKTEALKNFNDDHRKKYKAEFGITQINGYDTKFSARLICAKTNQEFQSLYGNIISLTEAAKIKKHFFPTSNKKINNTVEPSKKGFFSNTNKCKAVFCTSAAIGVAALTVGYLAARMK